MTFICLSAVSDLKQLCSIFFISLGVLRQRAPMLKEWHLRRRYRDKCNCEFTHTHHKKVRISEGSIEKNRTSVSLAHHLRPIPYTCTSIPLSISRPYPSLCPHFCFPSSLLILFLTQLQPFPLRLLLFLVCPSLPNLSVLLLTVSLSYDD